MQIVCRTCNATYNIRRDNLPERKATAKCKKCGGKLIIEPLVAGYVQAAPPPTETSEAHPPSRAPVRKTGEREKLDILQVYPEFQSLNAAKFDLGEIFPPNKKGAYRHRKNTFKLKVLQAAHHILEKALKDGEKVVRIAKGVAYYPAEIFFGNGFVTMLYNHYAIVCTNQRLLLININSRMNRPMHYIFQVAYENIKKVKHGFLSRTLVVYRHKGKRRTFRKSRLAVELAEEPLENLCPACFLPLKKGLVACPECKTRFKEPKKALLKSLLLPGWGDMYLGHRALGLLELLGSVFVWVIIGSMLLAGEPGSLIGVVILLMFYNGSDGLFTYHMAKKGYMRART
jgi:DNA-directed RNA polymerase subunit RPC12/RpoP